MDWRTMARYQRKPAKKQQLESIPACERSDKTETKNYYHPGQSREMAHRRTRYLKRWTEFCSELYTHITARDPKVLDVPQPINDSHPTLWEEVEATEKSLKKGKSAGVDNISSAGEEAMIDMLLIICNKIWQTGEWQSLIITVPKKGNLQLCQNYRTISLISHPSKVILRILLNRLKPQAEEIIKEEQTGFRAGRSTTEQIFNLRMLFEKYLQHQ